MNNISKLARRYMTLKELDFRNKLLKYGICEYGKFRISDNNEVTKEFLFRFGENNASFSKPKPNPCKEQGIFDYIVAAIVNYENALGREIKEKRKLSKIEK